LCTPEECDDGDPCTLDACDPAHGCRFDPLPDGAACPGEAIACVLGFECRAGACEAVVPEEGSPCEDGRACTTADRCEAGACVGESGPGAPAEAGVARLYGAGAHAAATVLESGDLLIADEHPLVYTVLRVSDDDRLVRRAITVDPSAWRIDGLVPLSGGRFL